ncbi:MAG: divalent cation tolerance protein CutA [Streptosporangiales bacterium]|nr:divalent cation tolerance protein CutA [Streptosporangiales bacterium]
MSEHVRVETTIDSERGAAELAEAVVNARLVACAQLVGPIRSTYWWEGAATTDEEWLLVLKTAADRLDDLVAHLSDVHPYEVPEIVAVPVVGGHPGYLQWVTAETRGG